MSDYRYISIKGVRTNSLNNIDVDIPVSYTHLTLPTIA